eukprot:3650928-Amphidinium_carterae.1
MARLAALWLCCIIVTGSLPLSETAKTDATAAFGKLVAAMVKCGGSAAGVNMNKFKHIWTAAHGLDKLDPVDVVWEVIKMTNPCARGLGAIYVTLKATKTVVCITCTMTPAGAAKMGTAYVVNMAAEGLLRAC